MIQAVIFDCDGVLVDSEHLTNRVICENLAARGLEWTEDVIMDRFVGGTMTAVGQAAAQAGARIEENWVSAIYEEMYTVLAEEVAEVAGVTDLLNWLDAQGIPYAVGSNGTMRKMQVTLGRCGLTDRFGGRLLSAQEVGASKPAPDVYLAAAKLLGVDPSQAVVVEDSATGARAARAAGMTCYGYAPEDDGAKLAAVGAIPFHAMRDLPALLRP